MATQVDESTAIEIILTRFSKGEMLNAICESSKDLPSRPTFLRWVEQHEKFPGLLDKYSRARAMCIDAIAEDTIRIADDTSEDPNSRRVRVATRQWLIGRLAPHKYGDKAIQVEVSGPDGRPVASGLTLEFLAPLALAAAEHVAASRPAEPILSPITYNHEPQPTDSIDP